MTFYDLHVFRMVVNPGSEWRAGSLCKTIVTSSRNFSNIQNDQTFYSKPLEKKQALHFSANRLGFMQDRKTQGNILNTVNSYPNS